MGDTYNEFFITLPSNSHPDNKTGNFTVHLPQNISLRGSWEVALSEIIFPFTWVNFPDFLEKDTGNHTIDIFVEFKILDAMVSCSIPERHYATVSELLSAIHYAMDNSVTDYDRFGSGATTLPTDMEEGKKLVMQSVVKQLWASKLNSLVKFKYNNITNKVSVKFEDSIERVYISKRLSVMLGFEEEILSFKGYLKTPEYLVAEHGPDLNLGVSTLYVYCDIVHPQFIGNKYAPLLRIVHVQGEHGTTIDKTFQSPHYLPVLVKDFSQLHIDIKSDAGQDIKFESGKTVVILHFKKKNTLLF